MDAVRGALKSKTMWFNLLAMGSLVLDHLIGSGIAASAGPISLAVVTAANLVLRAVTTKSLSEKAS